MNDVTKNKLNGFGSDFRFITPVMTGIIIAMLTYILTDIRTVKISLDNHLQHSMVAVYERLTTIEIKLEMLLKGGD